MNVIFVHCILVLNNEQYNYTFFQNVLSLYLFKIFFWLRSKHCKEVPIHIRILFPSDLKISKASLPAELTNIEIKPVNWSFFFKYHPSNVATDEQTEELLCMWRKIYIVGRKRNKILSEHQFKYLFSSHV